MLLTASACNTTPARTDQDNGITVDAKVYDTRSLENLLATLNGRLGQVSGIDQGMIMSRIGGLQGGSSTTSGASLQVSALGTPSVATTATSLTPSLVQTSGNVGTSAQPTVVQTQGSTTSSGTPSVAQTIGSSGTQTSTTTTSTANGTTSQTVTTTPSTTTNSSNQTVTTSPGSTSTLSNQSVATTPSNTLQTVTTQPAITPGPAPTPVTPVPSLPSSFNTSAVDTLNEQMQLSYQIINLQLLLQGAVSDDYTSQGSGRRKVTLGFPITISTPASYVGKVADIRVDVCDPSGVHEDQDFDKDPKLAILIPQEKTYNLARITGHSLSLGAGAVLANVVNIGASYSWTHQTYYIYKAQDTVAFQRNPPSGKTCEFANPVSFAWQFRPVLEQPTVDQGMRSTYAQISFPPPTDTSQGLATKVTINTCWRDFDSKTGIVGDIVSNSCQSSTKVLSTFFDTLNITSIRYTDNGNGTLSVTLQGTFPQATRVAVGESYMDKSVAGFEIAPNTLRFTAPTQALAVLGARLLSPDGTINSITLKRAKDQPSQFVTARDAYYIPGQFKPGTTLTSWGALQSFRINDRSDTKDPSTDVEGIHFTPTDNSPPAQSLEFHRPDNSTCRLPAIRGIDDRKSAVIAAYSDSLVKVTLPLWQCVEVGPPTAQDDWVVILAGHAFGLSDAPFLSFEPTRLSFLAPRSLVVGQQKLTLKRMFLSDSYQTDYSVKPAAVSVTGIAVVRSVKTQTTFAITGSRLMEAAFEGIPTPKMPTCCNTYALVTLSSDEIASMKQLILRPKDNSAPFFISLPTPPKSSDDASSIAAADYTIALLQSPPTADDPKQTGGDGKPPTPPVSGTPPPPPSVAVYMITSSQGSTLQDASIEFPKTVSTQLLDSANLQFSLDAKIAAATKQIALKVKSGDVTSTVLVTLPALPKGDDSQDSAAAKKLTFAKTPTSINQGSTGPYTIKGTNFQLITSFRYLGTAIPVHYSTDYTTATFDTLPIGFTSSPGKVSLEVRLTDGTIQSFGVPVVVPISG
jgi:hypothetical protein